MKKLVLILTTLVLAHTAAFANPFHHDHNHTKTLKSVDATPAQMRELKQIKLANQDQIHSVFNQMHDLHDQMHAAFSADVVDTASVERIRVEAIEVIDEGSKLVTSTLVQAANVLNVEQRTELMQQAQRAGRHLFDH